MALQALKEAFTCDVSPILAMARSRAGGAIDPVAAFRESGYREAKGNERRGTDTADRTRYMTRGMNQEERMRPGFCLKLLLLCFLTATAVHAQEVAGHHHGTVVDSSKAVIPGATVTVTNVAMEYQRHGGHQREGFFQAPYLIPGAYRITVELAGFKKLVREGHPGAASTTGCVSSCPLEVGSNRRIGHRDRGNAAARDHERRRSARSSTRSASPNCRSRTAIRMR